MAQDPFLFSATVRENIAFGRPRRPRGGDPRGADRAGPRVHRAAPRRLRDGDRRARDHALRRPAPAARDRARAARRPARADPRRRDRVGRRETEARIRLGLREAMRGRTTVIIAHRLSTIALADEVVVLDRGRIAARGTHDGLLSGAPSTARSTSTGCSSGSRERRCPSMRVWQRRRVAPLDGARRQRRRLVVAADGAAPRDARAVRPAVPAPDDRRGRLARRGDRDRARPRRTWRRSRSTTASAAATSASSPGWSARSCSQARSTRGTTYAQTYWTGWVGQRILADLRNDLFRHLQRLSLGFYERNRAGVIISRLTNDVEALDQLVTDGVTSLVQNTRRSSARPRSSSSSTGGSGSQRSPCFR